MTGRGLAHEDFMQYRTNLAELQACCRLALKHPAQHVDGLLTSMLRGGVLPGHIFETLNPVSAITVKVVGLEHPEFGVVLSLSLCGWRCADGVASSMRPMDVVTVDAILGDLFGPAVHKGTLIAPDSPAYDGMVRGPDAQFIWQFWIAGSAWKL